MNCKLLIPALFIFPPAFSQDEKPELNLQLAYHSVNNTIPYLKVETKYREGKRWEIVKGVPVKVYITEISDENLIGSVTTNDKGIGKLVLPVTAKSAWDSSLKPHFIAVSAPTKMFPETTAETEIARTRITIDTTTDDEGKRAVAVKVEAFESGAWNAAPDVEMKIGVKRLGSLLPIGEEESYTTDSTGMVTATFMRDSIPAPDRNGNIVIGVKVEENDNYGNLQAERTVPWGIYYKHDTNFGKRSLWSTGNKSPYWLLFMAYFTIAAVWGVIVYLVFTIIRIVKAGKAG